MSRTKQTRWNPTFAEIWTRYVSPARPSVGEIVLYTRYLHRLQKLKNKKIKLLVLGSTPEFRDWGYQENLDITVVDYNEKNYKVLGSFMRHKDAQERFVVSDWAEMKFENEFDLVIGDHAISVLKKENVTTVLERVAHALTKNGLFISKHYIQLHEHFRTPDEIIRYFRKKYPWQSLKATTMISLASYMAEHFHDYCIFADTLSHLEQLKTKGILSAKEYEEFRLLNWEKMKFNLYVPKKEEWEGMAKKHFKIIVKDHSEDWYADRMPIYILKKK